MRDDLKGLEITKGELRTLTNLPVKYELPIISNYLQKLARQFIKKVQGPEGITAVFIGLSTVVLPCLIFDVVIRIFASWIPIPSWILFILFCILGFHVSKYSLYLIWKQRKKIVLENMTASLEVLLNDVDRYHAVIKSIDINDKIEAAGNPEVAIKERHRVIEALKLTKSDLVRALKTERILRENQQFIIHNTDLFADNLANLTAMQVTETATEHGRFLNEALQIALDVQDEMKRLQSQG
ncbi:MAG: hypothetical protein QNJ47_03410 [Nostocaceae cyanobacterium]|nr:hypothetical protein [Nostocaceae cyanobacterium]